MFTTHERKSRCKPTHRPRHHRHPVRRPGLGLCAVLEARGPGRLPALAVDQEEAYTMLAAGEAIREELRRAGYAPR